MVGVLDNRMCSLTEQIAQGHADEMSAWPWHRFAQNWRAKLMWAQTNDL